MSGIAIAAICVYVLAICMMSNTRHHQGSCSYISVIVSDSTERRFVSAEEIHKYIASTTLNPIGKPTADVDCHNIELYVASHPMLEWAECDLTLDGALRIIVGQRIPVLRVMTADANYYVDRQRKQMPVRATTAAYVPIVTGRVSKRMATEELFDFVEWLSENPFWAAQIEQINVTPRYEIELTPRVGSGKILLGKLDEHYPERLDRLYQLYTKSFNQHGWKQYREIDLRYEGQIVCR